MWPYFLLFGAAFMGIVRTGGGLRREQAAWVVFGIALALMIGMRWRVGGDWGFEGALFRRLDGLPLIQALTQDDPGFALAAWVLNGTGLNIWTLNLVSGAIFTIGLIAFCRKQADPWLALLVAVPYLIIVVGMGYGRQSVAIGFELLALNALQDRRFARFLLFIGLAGAIHSTAVALVPIGLLAASRLTMPRVVIGGVIGFGLFSYLLEGRIHYFMVGYIDTAYQSQGAAIRVVMNALPAALFLLTRKRFELGSDQLRLWTVMSFLALGFIPLLILSPSSTAVDRMALYVIPLQLFVWSRLPTAWAKTPLQRSNLVIGVTLYSLAVLVVWLNFAQHASAWIPYSVFPFSRLDGVSS